MAYINGEFLDREARESRITLVKERLRKFRALIESGKASEYHIEEMRKDKDELQRLNRVHRAEFDFAYFLYEFLSDERNAVNEDNIVRDIPGKSHDKIENMAKIHRDFCDLCDYVDHVDTAANLAIASPRGHSKSGIFSNAFVLHQILFKRRHYILIISETDSLSKKLVGWVANQLKFNKKVIEHFGVRLHEKQTMNTQDNQESFITLDNILCEASSSGKQLRGKRHGAHRPDLCVVDDPSSMNNEGTKEAREKLLHWFNTVVMPIGTRSTSIIVVGTMVTATGLLNHVLNRKDFKPNYHSAIISDSDYPDLWQEYIELYINGEDGESDEFYRKNKDRMEEGAETAWGWRWSYRELMHERANLGTRAFNSEYRNLAYSEDEQYFFPEHFAYYFFTYDKGKRLIHFDSETYKLEDLFISGSWDIAQGKNARSCFNSCVIVGKHRKNGRIFVLDEYSTKEQPHMFLNVLVEKIKEWRPDVFSVETIQAQHEFYRQLEERLRHEGIYTTRLNPIKSHKSSKEQRIESLEPLCVNKTLVFNRSHKMLLEQMQQYPNGDYVDSIDSLQMSVENAVKGKARVTAKPGWL